jgi:hypothetical protein
VITKGIVYYSFNHIFSSLPSIYCYHYFCSYADRKITFKDVDLFPEEIISYYDNTVVFRLVKEYCDPLLMFRILYPDGTSNFINITNHAIPPDAFCDPYDIFDENLSFITRMKAIESIPNYILLTYSKIMNDSELVFGMIIEWNGNIKR